MRTSLLFNITIVLNILYSFHGKSKRRLSLKPSLAPTIGVPKTKPRVPIPARAKIDTNPSTTTIIIPSTVSPSLLPTSKPTISVSEKKSYGNIDRSPFEIKDTNVEETENSSIENNSNKHYIVIGMFIFCMIAVYLLLKKYSLQYLTDLKYFSPGHYDENEFGLKDVELNAYDEMNPFIVNDK